MASQFVDKQNLKFTFQVSTVGTFATTDVDLANDTVKIANHGLTTGTPIAVNSSGSVPTGLTATTAYYAIAVNTNEIAFATSVANAQAGTKVNLTAVGSGTGTIYKNGAGTVVLGVLPDNFIITKCFYDVITTFTSTGTDAATIALEAEGAGDLKAAIAISDATNVWDAGVHACLPGNYALDGNALTAVAMAAADAASMVKTDGNEVVSAAIAGSQTLTAGKLFLYVEGFVSE